MRFLIVAIVLALVVGGNGIAAGQEQAVFARARTEPRSDLVRFEPLVEVDWHSAATPAAIGFDINHLTAQDLAALRAQRNEIIGGVWIDYPVALEARVSRGRHSLISAEGISQLEIRALSGVAVIEFSPEEPYDLQEPRYWGDVLGHPRTLPPSGGFVVRSSRGVSPRRIIGSGAQLVDANGQTELRYEDRQTRAAATMETPWFTQIESAFGFRWLGQRYLFVSWGADHEGEVTPLCESNSSVYRIGDALEHVLTNSYSCDP